MTENIHSFIQAYLHILKDRVSGMIANKKFIKKFPDLFFP